MGKLLQSITTQTENRAWQPLLLDLHLEEVSISSSMVRAVACQNNDLPSNQGDDRCTRQDLPPCRIVLMLGLLRLLFVLPTQFVCSRRDLLLENLALRQQLAVLRQRHPQLRFATPDKSFWVMLRRLWLGWKRALILVQPETVVRWHREGFKLYWRWISRRRVRVGRKCVSRKLRELIFRMVAENLTWGAPAHSRRAENVGLRYFRANRSALDAKSAQES